MLRAVFYNNQGEVQHVESPSRCLTMWHRELIKVLEGRGLYWAIDYTDPSKRVAHFIREKNLEEFKRPNFKIVPAYRRGNA